MVNTPITHPFKLKYILLCIIFVVMSAGSKYMRWKFRGTEHYWKYTKPILISGVIFLVLLIIKDWKCFKEKEKDKMKCYFDNDKYLILLYFILFIIYDIYFMKTNVGSELYMKLNISGKIFMIICFMIIMYLSKH